MGGPVPTSRPRGGWRSRTGVTDGAPPRSGRPESSADDHTKAQYDPADYPATQPRPVVTASAIDPASTTNSAPPASLLLPVLACVLCLPAGVWSVIEAQRVATFAALGDTESARSSLRRSRTIALSGIGLGLAVIVAVLTVLAVGAAG